MARGTFSNGVVILDKPGGFRNGELVEVRPLRRAKATRKAEPERASKKSSAKRPKYPPGSLLERLAPAIGAASGPRDLAAQHDLYVHGLPKRKLT